MKTEEPGGVVSPQTLLDSAPMSRNQIRAVAVTSVLAGLDGYDVLAATFAVPGIARSWGVDEAALGLFLSSGLIGMAAGSLLLAPLADIIGRRKMVILNLVVMGFGMAMTGLAQSLPTLIFFRLLTGIGIGAMVPIVTPLAAEYANAHRRTLALAVMTIGYPVGATLGGFGAAVLLTHFGWPVVFFLGAALSFFLLPFVLLWMPEPLPFLLKQSDDKALHRVNALLQRFGHPPVNALPQPPRTAASAPYRQIFASGQRLWTLRAAAAYALFMFTLYYIMSWMPQIVAQAGYSASSATMVSTVAALAGTIASIALGFFGPRISRLGIGAIIAGLGGAAVLFTAVPSSLGLFMLAGGLVGICLYGGSVANYAFIVNAFPAAMRATGIGFVMALARGGGAASPALAGILIAGGTNQMIVAAIMGSAAIISGIIVATSPIRL